MKTYYVCGFPITDELYHYGIEGQKWGVRRFQNEDGSLTPAGKERYYGSQSRIARAASNAGGVIRRTARRYFDNVKLSIKKRHPWLMSDEELNRVVNRMNMEKRMRDLKADEKSSKAINRVLKDVGDISVNNARNFGQNFSSTAGRLIAEKMYGKKDNKNKDKDKKQKQQMNEMREDLKEIKKALKDKK